MTSTFHGLETALRGLRAQQYSLQTINHNVANANTPGYTRQRVNLVATDGFPSVGRNRPLIPGHMGTGVEGTDVQRVRNAFLDQRFRTEYTKTTYWGNRYDSLSRLEGLMNEPSEDGLASTFNEFWDSMQVLATNGENLGARSVVRQKGMALANTFNYLHDSIVEYQNQAKEEIQQTTFDINSILTRINQINQEIGKIEPHGDVPNGLYDQRDMLVDELSSLVNIKTELIQPGANASEVAEGKMSIEIVQDSGLSYDPPIVLLNGKTNSTQEMEVQFSDSEQAATGFSVGDKSYSFNGQADVAIPMGTLKAKIESFGFEIGGQVKGIYPDMLAELDRMAFTFATAFNEQHEKGQTLTEINGGTVGADNPFFVGDNNQMPATMKGFAGQITVSEEIMNDYNLIAAASPGNDIGSGDGGNAQALADLMKADLDFGNGVEASFTDYYEKMIGDMGTTTKESQTLLENAELALLTVDQGRQSISGVLLDEEITNMVKFQHAYNAAARSMTTVDEMLDRIINGMGRVGR
ncbi:flagellar hook-associated protein FlgK [Bacillaceae bacterium SIJ1]|uniref:flagellar hook-associated protein FlgK n=1 Tax=Litoribacterium kuwaitense TaxID=1398745 RepID=UPI0013EE2B16|nr:flagellar hook-associated protein FlgK [Litoribacterium kuwaitense]NGP44940.1 flagellar hook-associated protein FlgK [Litoribacterium kuwaitense]